MSPSDAPRIVKIGQFARRFLRWLCGAVLLAGLPLAVWSTSLVFAMVHDVWRARHWTPAHASVLHTAMAPTREARRLGRFWIKVKYRYVFGDRSYDTGRLVFTENTGDTSDVWDGRSFANIVEFIEISRRGGQPLRVFVNPDNPTEAVVFRDLVWGNYAALSLLMMVCGLFPFGVVAFFLPRWLPPPKLRAAKVFVALLFPLIALSGALVAMAAR